MVNINEIYVYENWKADSPSFIGTMHVEGIKGKQIVSFEYDINWLADLTNSVSLDPDLKMFSGRQYPPINKLFFGVFEDSCPDRWGRLLMKRREAINAKKEERKPKTLSEVDYLLGVFDETRMGGLRFSVSKDGPFLSNDKELATPPWTTLRKLESASLAFEKNEDGLEEKWLKQLIAPGSSLGGARPKASVVAPDGSLWIAKFPSKDDEINVGAWEMVTHDLAALCGLNVPEAKVEDFSKIGSTFLIKRFDRSGAKRIHFASAMTLLGKSDGANASDGNGYLDVASIIKAYGGKPDEDLLELWKRIVFNMAVSNTDDHLRNHGFILENGRWRLSPLYDVNPNIYGDSLSLNVDKDNNLIDFELVLSTAKLYGISEIRASEELNLIKDAVQSNWKTLAKHYGIKRSEIEEMSPAFDMRFK
ncbi:type II toxin-antitoxin system HipA family toxin [Butyrivibrio sp. MC2013]|uniref:type II toxin-antitoxin system HipA family toxin n=1 Tax=Butyrivibrio sp. MC2013 TaxID=1280686 RepID=UPI00041F2150|nr:HipA domain-containing protein [Butyrivibrio sp. MC2013]